MPRPAEPFDVIFVLGGGSSARPDGDAQLGPSGDRLIVPAKLFLAGKAGHLVASGLNVTDIGGSRSLADDTAALWRDLGIPETAITRLSEPRTTKEEIRAYKTADRDPVMAAGRRVFIRMAPAAGGEDLPE